MRNVSIIGAKPVGPPLQWDAATNGECLTLSVLFSKPGFPDMHTVTTAWQFDDAELHALSQGGHFFTSATLPFVPLQRLWVQDAAATVVGELVASEQGVQPVEPGSDALALRGAIETAAALRGAIIAIGRNLEARIFGKPKDRDWLGANNAGIAERLLGLVERVRPETGVTRIPIHTLDDLVRGDAGKGRPFPGEPVDQATQSELERTLGVELEPTAPYPLDWLKVAKAAGTHGIRYRTNRALCLFLDAIDARPRQADQDSPARSEDQQRQDSATIVEDTDGRFVSSFANKHMAGLFVSGARHRYRLRGGPDVG